MKDTVETLLINEAKYRLLEESIPRLRKCLEKMDQQQIWYRPNHQTVSAGNLVLHLCGNVRQWLVNGLGKGADSRNRAREFEETGPIATSVLMEDLEKLEHEISDSLAKINQGDLSRRFVIQGFEVTGVSILVHVVEHFSYHVGQVTYMVKSRQGIDMGYYENQNLDELNNPVK